MTHRDTKQTSEINLNEDLLFGADDIARALNWYHKDGRPNRRRVYHMVEKQTLPIHKIPGAGLCARRSTLKAYFDQLDNEAKKYSP